MVMAGCEFMGDIPFHTVYLHGTVRDTLHRKMSKSLGNGIDPLEVVQKFGADALRYTVIAGMAVGTDVILDPDDLETSFAPGRNFANKVWNAGRFVLSNLGGPADRPVGASSLPVRPLAGPYPHVVGARELGLADRWIIARCDRMVREATANYEKFRLNEAASTVYHFIWSDLADWYLEQVKPRLHGTDPGGDVARAVLTRTFEVALQVLHPIMPFITEALWKRFPGRDPNASIMRSAWPVQSELAARYGLSAEADFASVQEVVTAIRTLRAEYGIEPGRQVRAWLWDLGAAARAACLTERGMIQRLAKVGTLEFSEATNERGAYVTISNGGTVFVSLGDAIDLGRECDRLGKEEARLQRLVDAQRAKLDNDSFLSRAPAEVVERERRKSDEVGEQLRAVRHKREVLGCA
jgi:valyl-tRNA synthetase